jgi:hypothetical protein
MHVPSASWSQPLPTPEEVYAAFDPEYRPPLAPSVVDYSR